jgi:hypothetical protein
MNNVLSNSRLDGLRATFALSKREVASSNPGEGHVTLVFVFIYLFVLCFLRNRKE